MKLLPLIIFAGIFLSQASCKVPSSMPKQGSTSLNVPSDFMLHVKVTGGDENFSRLMTAVSAVIPPSDVQGYAQNNWRIVSKEINARYNALTNTTMDKIQREVIKCEGVSGVTIVRL